MLVVPNLTKGEVKCLPAVVGNREKKKGMVTAIVQCRVMLGK